MARISVTRTQDTEEEGVVGEQPLGEGGPMGGQAQGWAGVTRQSVWMSFLPQNLLPICASGLSP